MLMIIFLGGGRGREDMQGGPEGAGEIDFGQFRLRPALFFEFGQFDFGQFRLRPISTSANFWMLNFGTTKCGALEGWAPKGGGSNLEKVGPRRVGPRRVGPRRVGPRRVEPRRVEPRRVGRGSDGGHARIWPKPHLAKKIRIWPICFRDRIWPNRIWPVLTAFGQFWCFNSLAKFSVVVVAIVFVVVVPGCCLLLLLFVVVVLLLLSLLVPVGACWCHISGPRRFKHHQNSTQEPQERERRKNFVAGEEKKKREILGPPPFGPHPLGPTPPGPPPLWAPTFSGFGPPPLRAPTPPGPHPSGPPPLRAPTKNKKLAKCGLAKFGQQKLAKFGQVRLAKCGQLTLAKCGIGQIRFGQIRMAKSGLAKFGRDRDGSEEKTTSVISEKSSERYFLTYGLNESKKRPRRITNFTY